MKLNLIAAASGTEMGIGYQGDLPWTLREEMKHFNRMTTAPSGSLRNACILGRKTWESIPPRFRPLRDRLNVVLTTLDSNKLLDDVPDEKRDGVIACKSLEESLQVLSRTNGINLDPVWVIGGSRVYQDALHSEFCHRIYLTEIVNSFPCDTFFPKFDKTKFEEVLDPAVPQGLQKEGDVTYYFKVYEKMRA